jgi:hypothetical protein
MFDLHQEALIIAGYSIRFMQTCVPQSYEAEDISRKLSILYERLAYQTRRKWVE